MITREKKNVYWNLVTLSVLILIMTIGFACSNELPEIKSKDQLILFEKSNMPIQWAESMPKYDNLDEYEGIMAPAKFFTENLQYPTEALQQNIEGTVVLAFDITKEGKLVYPEVIRSVHPLLDKEALRLVKALPEKWKPAVRLKKTIATTMNTSITFKIKNGRPIEQTGYTASCWIPKDLDEIIEGRAYDLGLNTARFAGGPKALEEYMRNNTSSIFEDREDPIRVQFIVKSNGEVGEIRMVNHSNLITSEVESILRNMPKWTPGTINGKNVNSWEYISFPYAAAYATE